MSIIYKFTDNLIESMKPHISGKSDEDFEIVKYGLNVFLLDLYKLPIVFGLAYFLGVLKPCMLSYLFLCIIRNQAGGLHLKTGKGCLFYSSITLIGISYMSKLIYLSLVVKALIACILLYFINKYAPADTEQKPILNPDTRKRMHKTSLIVSVLYILASFTCLDRSVSNLFILVLILECIIIHPTTYKLFNRRYRNYEFYEQNN